MAYVVVLGTGGPNQQVNLCCVPCPYVSAFRPQGVPGPTSKLLLRVPAQMGRRKTEHKGENSKGKLRPRVVLCPGRMLLQ
jgi:hypothetical protein